MLARAAWVTRTNFGDRPCSQTITQSPILRPLTPYNRTTRESDAGGQYGRAACRGYLLDFGVFPDLEGAFPDPEKYFQNLRSPLSELVTHMP